jgi:hypothetical protein
LMIFFLYTSRILTTNGLAIPIGRHKGTNFLILLCVSVPS